MARKKASKVDPRLDLSGPIIRGELDVVKELVQRGASLSQDMSGMQPLHYAIEERKTPIAKWLIQNGADVNCQIGDEWLRTPLMMAAWNGKADIVQALIAAGANVHVTDSNGWTALDHAASCEGSSAGPMVQALAKAGADIHRLSKTWGTPLIKACWRGHPSAAQALISLGVDVDVMTANATPLIQAVVNKRAEVVTLLLGAGADPQARFSWPTTHGGSKDYLGKNALEVARAEKAKKIVAILEDPRAAQPAAPARSVTAADVPALWKRLEKALRKLAPELKKSLGKPATPKQLAEVEAAIGRKLPKDLQASYLIHDGQARSDVEAFVPEDWLDDPYYLMPLAGIVREWKVWKGLADDGEFKADESTPDEGVRGDWWHPGWIPFISNGGGDSLCLDLAPTAKGTPGQVIGMRHDAAERPLLARSFADFLGQLVEQWESRLEE